MPSCTHESQQACACARVPPELTLWLPFSTLLIWRLRDSHVGGLILAILALPAHALWHPLNRHQIFSVAAEGSGSPRQVVHAVDGVQLRARRPVPMCRRAHNTMSSATATFGRPAFGGSGPSQIPTTRLCVDQAR